MGFVPGRCLNWQDILHEKLSEVKTFAGVLHANHRHSNSACSGTRSDTRVTNLDAMLDTTGTNPDATADTDSTRRDVTGHGRYKSGRDPSGNPLDRRFAKYNLLGDGTRGDVARFCTRMMPQLEMISSMKFTRGDVTWARTMGKRSGRRDEGCVVTTGRGWYKRGDTHGTTLDAMLDTTGANPDAITNTHGTN